MQLPTSSTLNLTVERDVLFATLNRPARKNAMNGELLDALQEAFAWANQQDALRAVVLRGAGGTFCAGADLSDIQNRSAVASEDPVGDMAVHNRRFGAISEAANDLEVPLVAVVEGVALGGGFGLTCVADIALAHVDTLFGLPETQLGLVPAQIAPFVIQRIGVMATRKVALTGARFRAQEAKTLGLVDEVFDSTEALELGLEQTLSAILRCGPQANRATKRLLREISGRPDSSQLDAGARVFATCALSDEGREGNEAFLQKRKPDWTR